MEEDAIEFLIKIVNTIAAIALCMMLNISLGIYFNFAFFDTAPNWKNILYYVFFIVSMVLLVKYLYRKWKS
ncbi:MAG: hypothetical protein WCI49_11065 [Ferruginibacter sp.]